MSYRVEDEAKIERLYRLWDGNAQYVLDGGETFEVLTPDGVDEPVFVASGGYGYEQTSTGAVKAKEPVKQSKRSRPTKNAKLTDVGADAVDKQIGPESK